MPRKNPPTGTNADLNLFELSALFANEERARQWLESKRWPNGPVCPRCKSTDVALIEAKPGSKVRPGVYRCKQCRKAKTKDQFTVRIGTIFEESKIPICKWLMAIHLMTSSKKGISSHQIARELGVTVKSAWFVTNRIREAMKLEPLAGMLRGVVEADEAYVGGKPRHRGGPIARPEVKLARRELPYKARPKANYGAATKKSPVMVLVERDGSAHCTAPKRVTTRELANQIEAAVAKDAILMTDEHKGYTLIGRRMAGHETVHHASKEYVRVREDGLKCHVNTAESFFALLKRGHYGVFHQLSKKHLHRYCNEFGFRWNHRKVSDGERMVAAIKGTEGKRLMYREPSSNSA